VPASEGLWLDEEAAEMLAGEESRRSGQDCSPGSGQRSVDLASEHRPLVTQHHDLDREVCVTATGETG
jgi:hypothetical protein